MQRLRQDCNRKSVKKRDVKERNVRGWKLMLQLSPELKSRSVKEPMLKRRLEVNEKGVKEKKHNEKKPQRRKTRNQDSRLSVLVLTLLRDHEESHPDVTLHQLGQDQIQGLDLS
jgi:hypothetical protein